mmetsp:Transcript_69712/g.202108  ORF Transcript_69712/g.202108 Transcript_69712/m.202108 type:complete len:210 (-) Transcript_69712:1647-2276(-)
MTLRSPAAKAKPPLRAETPPTPKEASSLGGSKTLDKSAPVKYRRTSDSAFATNRASSRTTTSAREIRRRPAASAATAAAMRGAFIDTTRSSKGTDRLDASTFQAASLTTESLVMAVVRRFAGGCPTSSVGELTSASGCDAPGIGTGPSTRTAYSPCQARTTLCWAPPSASSTKRDSNSLDEMQYGLSSSWGSSSTSVGLTKSRGRFPKR